MEELLKQEIKEDPVDEAGEFDSQSEGEDDNDEEKEILPKDLLVDDVALLPGEVQGDRIFVKPE